MHRAMQQSRLEQHLVVARDDRPLREIKGGRNIKSNTLLASGESFIAFIAFAPSKCHFSLAAGAVAQTLLTYTTTLPNAPNTATTNNHNPGRAPLIATERVGEGEGEEGFVAGVIPFTELPSDLVTT